MIPNIFLFSVILLLPVSTTLRANLDTLKYTQAICRHGSRNPEMVYGKYWEMQPDIWPEGFSELTLLGKKQAFEAGKFLRERYNPFLPEEYNPKDVQVLSSEKGRTMKTALNLMIGLFRKFHDSASWLRMNNDKDAVLYEPVPIRTIPREIDNLLGMTDFCPQRLKILNDHSNSNFYSDYIKQSEALQIICNQTIGNCFELLTQPGENIPAQLYGATEVIFSLVELGKDLENWMKPLLYDEAFHSFTFHILVGETSQDLLALQVNCSQLLKLILDNISNYLQGGHERKLDVYSGHDRNIVPLMQTLGILDILKEKDIPTGSCLLVELHSSAQSLHEIELWYWKGTDKSLHRAKSLWCDEACPLPTFINMTSDVANVDYDSKCQLVHSDNEINVK